MEWREFEEGVSALTTMSETSASRIAHAGATLLRRTLEEMFLGEPDNLRRVAWRIAEARPTVVAIRNVGVAAYTTATEARVGDRIAASARSASRLARLIEASPRSLGHRTQPLMRDHVVTGGHSYGVFEALLAARERLKSVDVIEGMVGGNILVDRLLAASIPARLVPETGMVASMRTGEVTLIGCSALLADGSAIADRGAVRLARVAGERGVPVHVLADTLKLAPWLPRGASQDNSWEIVSSTLIQHLITEDGIRRTPQLLAAARDLSTRWKTFEPTPTPRI